MPTTTPVPAQFQQQGEPIRERQASYLHDLLDGRDLLASPKFFDTVNAMDADELAAYMRTLHAKVDQLTKREASKWIDCLKALPRKQGTKPAGEQAKRATVENFPNVPEGHYALEIAGDELNPTHFFVVRRGRDYTTRGGRDWTNYLFVNRFVSDNMFPVKGAAGVAVLELIAADPLAAAQLYGRETRRCCICHRKLTRALSRHLGIGPVCGAQQQWLTADMVTQAEAELHEQGIDPKAEMPDND